MLIQLILRCCIDFQFVFCFTWAMMYGPQEARYPFKLSHVFSKLGTVTSLGLAGTIMVRSLRCMSSTKLISRYLPNGVHGKHVHLQHPCLVPSRLPLSLVYFRPLVPSSKFPPRSVSPLRSEPEIYWELVGAGKLNGLVGPV